MNKSSTLTSGLRIGKLTLINEAPRKHNRKYWYCKCDCGNERIVQESHLKTGHTKSCGCLVKEKMKEKAFDLTGQRFGRLTVEGLAEHRKNDSVTWQCICDCGKTVFCETEILRGGITKSCGCLQEEQRKKNMEKAIHFVDGTCIEKIACQKEIASNTSGHRGVTKRENGKWRAEITFRGKRYNLGTYVEFEEAVKARLEGEQMYQEYLEEYYEKQKTANQAVNQ